MGQPPAFVTLGRHRINLDRIVRVEDDGQVAVATLAGSSGIGFTGEDRARLLRALDSLEVALPTP